MEFVEGVSSEKEYQEVEFWERGGMASRSYPVAVENLIGQLTSCDSREERMKIVQDKMQQILDGVY